ncbi:hypothetical protein Tco_0598615 [Tanacetum coccineum]
MTRWLTGGGQWWSAAVDRWYEDQTDMSADMSVRGTRWQDTSKNMTLCSIQPSSSTPPVPSTSSPPVITTPTPIPASIPSPTPIPETEPEPFEHTFEEPSPVHQPSSPPQEQAQGQMAMDDLLQVVPKLISRIDSLETDLKQTKLTMGNAIVKLVKKVKKLEGLLKKRHVVLSDSEEEEPEAQGRKSQDDPLDSSVQGLVTPSTTKVKASGEEQVEDISPNTLEAAKTLSKVASLKPRSIDKGRRYKRRKEAKGKKVVSSLEFKKEVILVLNNIATYKIIKQGEKGAYQIVREDGTDVVYINFGAMLKDITRDDLTELYRIVMNRYGMDRPEDELEKVFWKYLKNMFEEPLSTDHKTYPLSAEMCKAMLDKKLQGGKPDENCYKMLKMMEKALKNSCCKDKKRRLEVLQIKNNLKNSIYNILRKLKVFKVKIKNVLKELEVHNLTKASQILYQGPTKSVPVCKIDDMDVLFKNKLGPEEADFMVRDVSNEEINNRRHYVLTDYGTEAVSKREIRNAKFGTAEVDHGQKTIDEALKINLELLEEKREQAAIKEAKSKRQMGKVLQCQSSKHSFKPGDLVFTVTRSQACAEDTE